MTEFELPEGYEYKPTQNRQREVNPRKSKCIPNRTNYFNPDGTRTYVRFSSPDTYRSRQQKIEGYENRIYWEYRWCCDNSGTTYFYTLTYNDKAMPKYEGQNCFDYADLRYLLNGAFKKTLLRKYGTNFKYFVGAELGEGKGSRGMHNNPHYHVLFFTYPDEQYHKFEQITPEEFRHLVKMYWQGCDETRDGFRDYRDFKFGVAKEGDNLGVVTDYRACTYVAKYVTKEAKLRYFERKVRLNVRNYWYNDMKVTDDNTVKERFWNEFLVPAMSPFIKGEVPEMSDTEIFAEYAYLSSIWTDASTPAEMVTEILRECPEIRFQYHWFVNQLVEEEVRLAVNEYRNRYCNKCRCSQGLGDYALKFIDDEENPRIKVPSKKGFKYRPLNLFYYRKLFCDVVKDDAGQNVYVLNEKGVQYKLSHLPEQLEKTSSRVKANVASLTRELYEKMLKSDVNEGVTMTYEQFIANMNNKDEKIYDDYAKFKIIYEDRWFKVGSTDCENYDFPILNPIGDYECFLRPAIYEVPYSSVRCSNFIQAPDYGYLPYAAHPDFLPNMRLFGVFDLYDEYLACQSDALAEKQAEEMAAVYRFHKEQKIKDYYGTFLN